MLLKNCAPVGLPCVVTFILSCRFRFRSGIFPFNLENFLKHRILSFFVLLKMSFILPEIFAWPRFRGGMFFFLKVFFSSPLAPIPSVHVSHHHFCHFSEGNVSPFFSFVFFQRCFSLFSEVWRRHVLCVYHTWRVAELLGSVGRLISSVGANGRHLIQYSSAHSLCLFLLGSNSYVRPTVCCSSTGLFLFVVQKMDRFYWPVFTFKLLF